MIPTVQTEVIEKDGFHKRVVTRSYAVLLCESGGSRIKAIRLDKQSSVGEAIRTALADNPGWKLKRADPLNDRDFDEESKCGIREQIRSYPQQERSCSWV